MIELIDQWKIQDSLETYGVKHWGKGYFGINKPGHVTVHPDKNPDEAIDLKKLIDQLQRAASSCRYSSASPTFSAIASAKSTTPFSKAMAEYEYPGDYCCVYPIKVNQQRHVVEEILDFGKPFGFGLEAGSKPELLAVLALTNGGETPIICNGFKDDEFIKMTVLARKIGKHDHPRRREVHRAGIDRPPCRGAGRAAGRSACASSSAAAGAGRWRSSAGYPLQIRPDADRSA